MENRVRELLHDTWSSALAAAERDAGLAEMLGRYAALACGLIDNPCARYRGSFRPGATSFRPCAIENRGLSWRHDDTRMHVDAFPSNPMQGRRILRVFTNVHSEERARTWLIGERFPAHSQRFLAAKSDLEYQRNAPRQEFGFPAGSTWICFTDCVVRAATAGQFALEQTLYIDVEAMQDRAASPLAVLEKLTGRALAP